MNLIARASRTIIKLLCLMAMATPAISAPGAHGPNGEHLDGPAVATGGTDATPKMEAKSEDFELVATLSGGELSIMINDCLFPKDRFQSSILYLLHVDYLRLRSSQIFH